MNKLMYLLLGIGVLLSAPAMADAPLKSSLGLSIDQAAQVDHIQDAYRRQFSTKRQEYNLESRKLLRARLVNDSARIAELQRVRAGLAAELREIREAEDQAIRELLTPQQQVKSGR